MLTWHAFFNMAPLVHAGISLVDAGAIVLLLAGLTYCTLQVSLHLVQCFSVDWQAEHSQPITSASLLQARNFVASVNVRTLEASDFTVLVQGLPEGVTFHEV